jgi:hypothetical protein
MVLGDSPKRKYRRDDAQYNISVGDAFMGAAVVYFGPNKASPLEWKLSLTARKDAAID